MSTHKMHADEADIDVALVKRLLTTQFPQWADLPIERVDSAGTDNAIYRLGNDMAVRLPRIEEAASHIDKEYRWLPQLASNLFRETAQVDDATWARGRGWALNFGVVALPYYEKTNPVLAGSARKAIDEILADQR